MSTIVGSALGLPLDVSKEKYMHTRGCLVSEVIAE